MFAVQFYNADRNLILKDKKRLKLFLPQIFTDSNKALATVSYIFCSDHYLLQINNEFLQHDFYTDIITFNLSDNKKEITGEIYISIDRVKDNALQLKQHYTDEIKRVIFHGALHLCGYKDKKTKDIETMRRAEDFYMIKFQDT